MKRKRHKTTVRDIGIIKRDNLRIQQDSARIIDSMNMHIENMCRERPAFIVKNDPEYEKFKPYVGAIRIDPAEHKIEILVSRKNNEEQWQDITDKINIGHEE